MRIMTTNYGMHKLAMARSYAAHNEMLRTEGKEEGDRVHT